MDIILNLLSKKTIAPSIIMLQLQPDKKIDFQAGQYLNLLIPSGRDTVEKAFSVASDPGQETIEFIVRIIDGGLASTFLKNLRAGDAIGAKGPKGSFVISRPNPAGQLIFFSSGTGIAPIRSMIRDVLVNRKPLPIFFYITQENEGEFLLKNELKDLARQCNNFHFEYNADPLKTVARITQQNNDGDVFYVCGGPIFVSKIRTALTVNGIQEHQIHFERY